MNGRVAQIPDPKIHYIKYPQKNYQHYYYNIKGRGKIIKARVFSYIFLGAYIFFLAIIIIKFSSL